MKHLTSWNPASITLLVVVGLLLQWYMSRRAVDVAKTVGNGVNPMNHDNWINSYFEDSYRSLTGSSGSPGGDFYDWSHAEERWWN